MGTSLATPPGTPLGTPLATPLGDPLRPLLGPHLGVPLGPPSGITRDPFSRLILVLWVYRLLFTNEEGYFGVILELFFGLFLHHLGPLLVTPSGTPLVTPLGTPLGTTLVTPPWGPLETGLLGHPGDLPWDQVGQLWGTPETTSGSIYSCAQGLRQLSTVRNKPMFLMLYYYCLLILVSNK